MTIISGVPPGWVPQAAARVRRASTGFHVAEENAAAETPAAASVPALLCMQESPEAGPAGPAPSDTAALQHGEDLLSALTSWQRAMVGSGSSDAASRDLDDILARRTKASDPGLTEIVEAIALRAKIVALRGRPGP